MFGKAQAQAIQAWRPGSCFMLQANVNNFAPARVLMRTMLLSVAQDYAPMLQCVTLRCLSFSNIRALCALRFAL